MKRSVLAIVILLLVAGVTTTQSLSFEGDKTESDVLVNSLRAAASEVTRLGGVGSAERVGVLLVQDSGGDTMEFYTSGGVLTSIAQNLPIVGWFMNSQHSIWSIARLSEGTSPAQYGNTYSRSSVAEDFLISELLDAGVEVVETIQPYYGNINSLLTDADYLRNIGDQLGVDVVIIGSLGGSVLKVIVKEDYLNRHSYFVSDTKLTLRSVDTRTNTVIDSQTFSGTDSVETTSDFKWFNIVISAGLFVPLIFLFVDL